MVQNGLLESGSWLKTQSLCGPEVQPGVCLRLLPERCTTPLFLKRKTFLVMGYFGNLGDLWIWPTQKSPCVNCEVNTKQGKEKTWKSKHQKWLLPSLASSSDAFVTRITGSQVALVLEKLKQMEELRTKPGCRYLERMEAISPPEMQRVPLENVYLQASRFWEDDGWKVKVNPAACARSVPVASVIGLFGLAKLEVGWEYRIVRIMDRRILQIFADGILTVLG